MPSVEHFLETADFLIAYGSPTEPLRRARALLADRSRLVRGHRAVDEEGRRVRPVDPSAVAWDLEGAIARESNVLGIVPPMYMCLLDRLIRDVFDQELTAATFSDYNDHRQVLRLLDLAIKELE